MKTTRTTRFGRFFGMLAAATLITGAGCADVPATRVTEPSPAAETQCEDTMVEIETGTPGEETATATEAETETPVSPAEDSPAPELTPSAYCDGVGDEDCDRDGVSVKNGDCDDDNPLVNPGAYEACKDGVDNDCDGLTEDQGDTAYLFQDSPDLDGFGDSGTYVIPWDCSNTGGTYSYAWKDGDCDNRSDLTYPGAPEIGDGVDNDCNGLVDDNVDTIDNDGDGYSEADGDCDDTRTDVNPGADENPFDSADEDCNGRHVDYDGDGYYGIAVMMPGNPQSSDCNDFNATVHAFVKEVCNGLDDDCDWLNDEEIADCPSAEQDSDGDGYNPSAGDCDDTNAQVWRDPETGSAATEICDGVDNDCDFYVDEVSNCTVPVIDMDWDGWLTEDGDCIDYNAAVYPGAAEIVDGLDNDCDGIEDEIDP